MAKTSKKPKHKTGSTFHTKMNSRTVIVTRLDCLLFQYVNNLKNVNAHMKSKLSNPFQKRMNENRRKIC